MCYSDRCLLVLIKSPSGLSNNSYHSHYKHLVGHVVYVKILNVIMYSIISTGECNNKDCQFMHVDAETLKVKDCPWYDRGFCKHGQLCNIPHTPLM